MNTLLQWICKAAFAAGTILTLLAIVSINNADASTNLPDPRMQLAELRMRITFSQRMPTRADCRALSAAYRAVHGEPRTSL